MYLRCVRATRASARDMCSTLPARRVDLSRFTMSVTRMYRLCFSARHAFCIGFSRVGARNVCAPTDLIGSVVHCRTQPWKVHARTTALGHREAPF